MALLVTGGAGYIGSHMVLHLVDAGEDVVVLDNLSSGFDWAVDPRAQLIFGSAGDIRLVQDLVKKFGITEILHFAGSITVPESVVDPAKYYGNNTMTSRNLIDAAITSGIRHFIFSSSAAVYGMSANRPIVEETPSNPTSPYGRSKLMTEWILQDVAAAFPITYGILRYFNVAGADPQARSGQSTRMATQLMKVACQTALGQRPQMEIFGTDFHTPDGTCVRDFIHVTDLVQAHARLLAYLRHGGRSTTLNCTYGQGYSVQQVVDMVKEVSGVDFPVCAAPRRLGDPDSLIAKGTKIREVLQWTPQHDSLSAIVQTALTWEKNLSFHRH